MNIHLLWREACKEWGEAVGGPAEYEIFAEKLLAAAPVPPQQGAEPSEQDAYDMGAKGAPPTERERLLFEAWMRGHCWALCATWDGKQYTSDAEQGGDLDPRAMATRRLFAAWRDRAALPVTRSAPAAQPSDDALPPAAVAAFARVMGDPTMPPDESPAYDRWLFIKAWDAGVAAALGMEIIDPSADGVVIPREGQR